MLTTALLLALAAPALPQEPADSTPKPQPLFESREVLELTLATDLRTVVRDLGRHVGDNEFEGEEEHPARLSYVSPSGETVDLDIQVKTRGHFRRQKTTCNFPPLRLNIKTGQAKGTLFENQDKIKLVTHCQDGRDDYEQNVLLEYLLYRAYEALDTLSYRVRLTRITYVDTTGRRDTLTKYGFLIEDEEAMSARNGARSVEWPPGPRQLIGKYVPGSNQLLPQAQDSRQAVIVDIFQYMIGNTDWSAVEFHNVKLVEHRDGTLMTVPYDFDFSGAVNARYANPDESLNLRNVKQRLFRGFCHEDVGRDWAIYEEVVALFLEKKEEIYDLYTSQEGADEGRMEDVLEFYDDFYEIIEDPGRIESRMMRSCRRLRMR